MAKRRAVKRKTIIQRYYRTIITVFGISTVAIVILIAYFSFSKTVIDVTIVKKPYTTSTLIEVVGKTEGQEQLQTATIGLVLEKNYELTKEFTDLTTQSEAPAKAQGAVIIYNHYSKTQPLVASTRLLSDSGVLFRTDKRVDVPAGGQVEVTVTADQPGQAGEIGPAHFTLPALWLGLQDKIYAESSAAMTGGTIAAKMASAEDIQKAKTQTFDECYNQALDALEAELLADNAESKIQTVKKEIISETASVEPGTVTDKFSVTTKLHLVALSYDETAVQSAALGKVRESLTDNTLFTLASEDPYEFDIENYNIETQTASLRITISGTKQISSSHPIFERQNLINKDRPEILSYFT
ncbi:MAG: hypothetical protein PHI73_04870, partial [Patescibacteria group bacterium]|nr:hypothetical protein [Patescibacteria group bacterium]